MSKLLTKVIGYFAVNNHTVLCEGEACVITSNQSAMNRLLNDLPQESHPYEKRKTTLGQLIEGLSQGAEYAFDKDSYMSFKSLSEKHGFLVSEKNTNIDTSDHVFTTVRMFE